MVSLLSNLWSIVVSKGRLVIEYVLLFILLALAGWSIATWYHNRETVNGLQDKAAALETKLTTVEGDFRVAQGDLKTAIRANEDQDAAIAELRRLRGIDSRALATLQGLLTKADAKGETMRRALADLKRSNADAQVLLDTAVPAATGCVLDRTPCPGAVGSHADGGGQSKAK